MKLEVSLTKRTSVALVALAAIFLVSACSRAKSSSCASAAAAKKSGDRKLAPDFTLKDATGAPVRLSDFRGKVVLLNFWATWCGPCAIEIPWFIEFEQQFKSQGFAVIGISMDDDGWAAVKPFIAERKINYRVLLGNDSVTQLYGGVESLPTTFMIDRDGKLAFSPHVGLAGKNEYLNEIQTLLCTDQPTASRRVLHSLPALLLPGSAK